MDPSLKQPHSICERSPLQHPSRANPNNRAFRQLLERWLLRVRWAGVPLCLLLIPLFPAVPVPRILTLALSLAAANGLLTWLHDRSTQEQINVIRSLGMALEWSTGLAIIFLCCRDPTSTTIALGILTTLVAMTTARYGLPGLLGAELAAGATGLALFAWLMSTFSTPSPLLLMLGRWEAILLPIGLVTGALLRAREEAFRQQETPFEGGSAGRQHEGTHLSEREDALLPLLAAGISYASIAEQLSVSPETVKTHIRRLSRKLHASGRNEIVMAARQQGWLDEPKDFER